MTDQKNIFIFIGSASRNSANERISDLIVNLLDRSFKVKVFTGLKSLPHFDPELSNDSPPAEIIEFRRLVETADGVIICTPEYVFSIPSGLKNALEWCVSTTIFSGKPTGLITASASGEKGHEELKLIMKTLMANFTDETCLLIQGVKGKINEKGEISDGKTIDELTMFVEVFKKFL